MIDEMNIKYVVEFFEFSSGPRRRIATKTKA